MIILNTMNTLMLGKRILTIMAIVITATVIRVMVIFYEISSL